MDNLCHTLVGAAIGETGLKRRSALGMATLMIGANLPDIDALAVFSEDALVMRRGITHGILALAIWPFLLTGTMMLWDRVVRRRRGRVSDQPIRPRALLLLATIAILTHPFLDWMNTYGMRWLMPFSERWFYADVLFILDPWMWMALGLGVVTTARRLGDGRRAALALIAVTVYMSAMAALTLAGRAEVRRAMVAAGLDPDLRLLVGPVPVNALRREVVIEAGDRLIFGTLAWTPAPRSTIGERVIATNADAPEARAAARTHEGATFLRWARFPYYVIDRRPDGVEVFIGDARYNRMRGRTWAAVTVWLPVDVAPAVPANP
ncbi:MAG TPA: metal-dependent hydrolase [Gemmatimonadaceae bacterium]|nr:metal-dependent hydrolase [Gemmatimonadaceae bacterium]